MTRTDTSGWPCTIARSADLLGDGWVLLVMRQACLGVRRFEDFQRSLGIGRKILTIRLKRLVDEGLLDRVEYQHNPVRHEYRLTDKGRDVYPILAAMAAWGDRWLTGPEGTPLVLHHTSCDHDMQAVVACSHCSEPIHVREMRAKAGPGYPRPDNDISKLDPDDEAPPAATPAAANPEGKEIPR
jgi:DNA-binding HxlR family transcriptional regulator